MSSEYGVQPQTGPDPAQKDPERGGRPWWTTLLIALVGGLIGALATAAVLGAQTPEPSPEETRSSETSPAPPPGGGITIEVKGEDLTYAEAVAIKATPSVVSVAIEQTAVNPITGRTVTRVVGKGSGVIIRSDGHILTNDHVVAGADRITVSTGVDSLPAKIVGRDPSSDLAVVKVERAGLPAIEIGTSSDLRVGQPVVAIGSPFGLDQSVTAGIISALGRTSFVESAEAQITAYTSLIQTDAAINPGNSGGALTDAKGRLIGINTLIQTGSEFVAQSAGVGFAIPVDYAITIADDLIETGKAEHPYLGIASLTVSEQMAEQYNLPVDAGVLVDSVEKGSPAEKAGIKPGDIIVRIGDKKITGVEDVFLAIRSHQIGDTVEVELYRGRERLTLKATLGSDSGT